MFENPRRGRQPKNFTTNVPKILDLKSSSEQIFSENCRWVPPMLDGAFMQETSNIIEDTFSAYNICKGRIFEEINKGTAWVLGSEKYIKRRTRFCSTRVWESYVELCCLYMISQMMLLFCGSWISKVTGRLHHILFQ